MLTAAIRSIATKGGLGQSGAVQLFCRVKPGVSAERQGISSVSNEVIQVGVAPQAREGQANKAVRDVVAQVLRIPKSEVEIIKGMRSHEKVVAVTNFVDESRSQQQETERIKIILQGSVTR